MFAITRQRFGSNLDCFCNQEPSYGSGPFVIFFKKRITMSEVTRMSAALQVFLQTSALTRLCTLEFWQLFVKKKKKQKEKR